MMLHTTNDDQLFLFFLMFSYVYVNVRFLISIIITFMDMKSHMLNF
jgi:hypothetical protein